MTTPLPSPGIYPDIPFEEYLEWPAVNNSSLDWMAKSPAHFRYAMTHGLIREETPAMRLGTLCHAGKFEPLRIIQRYAVMPAFETQIRRPNGGEYEKPKSSAAYRDEVRQWREEHKDKIVVEQKEYDEMIGVVRAIDAHPAANRILTSGGETELSIVWTDSDTGIACKARLDFVRQDKELLADLKTTRDASQWTKAIRDRSYHRQFAFYRAGWHKLTGVWATFINVVAETSPPFCVRCAPLGSDSLQMGADLYRFLLHQMKQCTESGAWPGYEDPIVWEI